jgi:hypothetical protein
MFTIKLYSDDGYRIIVKSAESFTILRSEDGEAEITLHQRNPGDDCRIDIKSGNPAPGWPPVFAKAIIENAAGKTTEIIALRPVPIADRRAAAWTPLKPKEPPPPSDECGIIRV